MQCVRACIFVLRVAWVRAAVGFLACGSMVLSMVAGCFIRPPAEPNNQQRAEMCPFGLTDADRCLLTAPASYALAPSREIRYHAGAVPADYPW